MRDFDDDEDFDYAAELEEIAQLYGEDVAQLADELTAGDIPDKPRSRAGELHTRAGAKGRVGVFEAAGGRTLPHDPGGHISKLDRRNA